MDDLFETRKIRPMLIGADSEPFDSDECLFELKLDGERCLAFLGDGRTELRNKRDVLLISKFPELRELHRQVKKRCILDGELMVSVDGKPDFAEVQRRSLMSNAFKIQLASEKAPASFVAFDILYYNGETLMGKPLSQRKALLEKYVTENERLAVSRCIERQGRAFFQLAREQELEGIVAKRKDSLYYSDKRTKDWIKIKNFVDDDFIICGYIFKEKGVISLVLAQYGTDGQLVYKGHVTMGVSGENFQRVEKARTRKTPPFPEVPPGNERAVWLSPTLVCTVKYIALTERGGLRHAVLKGLRADKRPEECVEPQK